MDDGTIEPRSAGEGMGSEFIVRLPILSKPTAALDSGADGAQESPVHRRILIVDDNRDSAESLAMLFEITGNKTYVAYDALKRLKQSKRIVRELCCWTSDCRGSMDTRFAAVCANKTGAKTS
jgi:hypothetical protein